MNVQPGSSPVPSARSATQATQDKEVPPATSSAEPGRYGPLLSDAAGLHARWQEAQAQFVDDPREALSDAADLVEQTAQAVVGTLNQRQRQLRLLWDHGSADADELSAQGSEPAPAAHGRSDTERLRLVMQRYRDLFTELCRPSPAG
jgi:hypothetical protein